MTKKMRWIDYVAILLLVIGGINWGLVGAFNYDLVQALLGQTWMARVVYGLVGVSGAYGAWFLVKQAFK